MDFGEILGKAWKIIWKNKVLWIFGILAGCGANGGSSGGGGNSSINQSNSSWGGDSFGGMFPQAEQFFRRVESFFENIQEGTIILVIIGLVVLALLVSAIVLFLSSIGKAGLIYGASQADETDETAEKLTFKQVWNGGKPFFWRIVLLNLLVGAASIILVLLLVLPAILLSILTLGVGLFCILPLLCIMVPAFWLVDVFIEQAMVAIVVEDLGIFDSIKRSWQVVIQENLGSYIVLGLILGIGGAIVGFVIALPMLLMVIPIVIALIAESRAVLGGGLITALVLFILYLPVLLVLSGILQAYVGSAWTLAFRQSASASLEEPVDFDGDLELLSNETPDSAG
ncbi:MAG: hypothetical protein K8R77_08785 [Anaerolineaceae bacterium]|nr:hypothetical protein [Anaerolineaceae bacterium]